MAVRTWNSGGSTDANNPANYTGAGPLLVTDDLEYDNLSAVAAIFTAPISVHDVLLTVDCNCTVDSGGFALSASQDWKQFNGTMNANASVITVGRILAITAGNHNAGTSTYDCTGTGTVRNSSYARRFYKLKIAANGQTTTIQDTTRCGILEVGTGNWTSVSGKYTYIGQGVGSVKIFINNGVTTDDTGGEYPAINAGSAATNGSTQTLDGLVQGANGWFNSEVSTNSIVQFLDDWSCQTFRVRNDGTGGLGTVDMNGKNLTVTGPLAIGTAGGAGAGDATFKCGSGIIDVQTFTTQVLMVKVAKLDMESCTFRCSHDFEINHANHVVDGGTSTIEFDGAGAQAITSKGNAFNDVVITKGGNTATLQDAFACATFSDTGGSFNDGGFAITVSGAVNVNSAGTFTATGSLTVTGDADLVYADAGTYSVDTQDIILQGSGRLRIGKASTTVANITCAANGKTTNVDVMGAFSGWNTTLTLGVGTITINTQFYWQSSTALIPIVNGGATINGISRIVLLCDHGVPSTVSLPTLTMGGTTTLRIWNFAGNAVVTLDMTGAITAPIVDIANQNNNAAAGLTLNTNGHAINAATDFSYGNDEVNGGTIMNFGASAIAAGSVNATAYNGVGGTTLNMGTSAWTVTGTWTTQTNHTIAVSAWTLLFIGNNAGLISAGKAFGAVTSNKVVGQTLNILDALACTAFTITQGDLATGNFAITASGNVILDGGAVNLGTSIVTCTGNGITARIGAGAPIVANSTWVFTGNAATLDLANGGATTILRLDLLPTAAYTWAATANELTISTYVAGDWNTQTWTSGTPGTAYHIAAPAGVVVLGLDVTDCHNNVANVIDATGAGNVDGGNNEGFNWPSIPPTPPPPPPTGDSQSRRLEKMGNL